MTNTITTPFTKGELMQALYSETELRNVDSAIPMDLWSKVDRTFWYVMDYNGRCGGLGKLVDMRELAKQKGFTIKD